MYIYYVYIVKSTYFWFILWQSYGDPMVILW